MKFINPKVHGVLDYLYVIAFALAPSTLHMTHGVSMLSYVIAAGYLVFSLLTRYPLGLVRVIPFPVHGGLEILAAIFLIVSPWLFRFSKVMAERNFYVVTGIVLVGVWLFTNYRATLPVEQRAPEREKVASGR